MSLRLNTALPHPQAELYPQNGDSSALSAEPGWGEKAAHSVQTGLRDLTDPAFFGPMLAAQGVFGLSRWGLLKILPQTMGKGGAWITANLGAFGLEGISFAGSARGLQQLMGRALSPEADFSKELGHTYLTLGLLKSLGGVTQSALQIKYRNIPTTRLAWQDHVLLKAAPQAAMFGGIYSSHSLAPHLGLGEYMDPADRIFQSVVTVVHFGLAGHMMNRIPGYAQANQGIHQETQRLIQSKWNRLAPNALALTPEGIDLHIRTREDPASSLIVRMDSTEESKGEGPSAPPSIPPPSLPPSIGGPNSVRQSLAPPNGKGNGTGNGHENGNGNGNGNGGKTRLKDRVGRLGRGAKALTQLEFFNRFNPPNQKPEGVKRETLPPPVGSVEEGQLMAEALGLGQRQVWHMRRILDHTRDMPETRQAFLRVERDRIAFHKGLKKLLDPILKKFRSPSLKTVEYGIESYQRAIEHVLGNGATEYQADALLNLYYAQQILDPVFRAQLSEADLIRMGFEPRLMEWAKSNGDKFWPGALEAIIQGNPELASLPGAEKVIEAARSFRLEPLEPENLAEMGRRLKETVNSYRDKIARGDLTLSEKQAELWSKVSGTCEIFHPEKILGPDGAEAQREILAAKQAKKKPPRAKDFQKAAITAVETGEALFRQVEDLLREFKENPKWEDLRKAKDEFPAPKPYLDRRMTGLMRALSRYLKNEGIAALWISETAVHNSLREMMRRPSDSFLSEVLREVQGLEVELLSPEDRTHFTETTQKLQTASQAFQTQQLRAASERYGNVHGLLDGLARLVGRRDYSRYHRAEGEFEHAIQDVLLDYESFLIPAARRVLEKRLQAVEPTGLDRLQESRERLMTWYEGLAQEYRVIFKEMEPEVHSFLEFYDGELVGLREKGMRVGLLNIKELAQAIHQKVQSEALHSELLIKTLEWERRFEELIQGNPGEGRGKPLDPNDKITIGYHPAAERALKGMINPRDFQRNIEEPLKLVMNGYLELQKIAERHGVDLGEFHPMLPMFEPYVFKYELLQELRHRLPFIPSVRFERELPRLGPLKFRDWERVRRMALYALPAIGRVFRLGSIQHHGYPFAEGARQFLDFGSSINDSANPQTFYLQNGIERVAKYFHTTFSADHNVHLDFIGNADNVLQAMLGPYAQRISIPDIIAKLDLAIPVIDTVFPYLTNMIGYQNHHLAMAFQRASRMQALGGLEFERMEPTMPLGYDNITMDVTNGEGLYVRDPASTVTGSLPVMGRLFAIAEGAAVLTGRPQGMTFVQDPGELRNFPAQRADDRMAALLNNPTSLVTLFMPASALPESKGQGKITYRNNLERLIWYLQAFHPKLDAGAPETDALFYEKYKKPLDPETERIVAELFAESGEHYPTAQSIRALEAQREELNLSGGSVSSFRRLGLIDQALDRQTRQILTNRLTVLNQLLTRELKTHPDIPEAKGLRRRQRMIQARLKILEQVEQKAAAGEPLSLTEKKFLQKAQAYYSGKTTVEARDPLLDQVEFYFTNRYPEGGPVEGQQALPQARNILNMMDTVIELVTSSRRPNKEEILTILKNRQRKLAEAIARYNLGEPLTPVDQILIEDMIGANSREEHPPRKDALVSALLSNHITPERLDTILKAETIREASRALIEKLPGGGRGTVDPIRESTEDAAKVMVDAAGDVVAGPRSHWGTAVFAVKFAGYASSLGLLGGLDLLTGRRTDFYTLASPSIARHAMSSVGWRPVLSAQDVRALEEIQIESAGLYPGTASRPIALAANHASWTDITTLMAVFPKMRFAFKKELMRVPFLNLALWLGHHTKIDRPENNTPEERDRAFRQVQESGNRMVKTGLSPTFFHSGTRSLTGVPGAPKDGVAHLAIPTNALILGASLMGTRQIMGDGGHTFKAGMGTDRRVYIGLERVDPRNIVDLDAVLAQRSNVKNTVKAGKKISAELHQRISSRFLEQMDHLRGQAQRGDAMAQAQWAEQMAAIAEGMELIRQGREREAKDWAREQKTDYAFLEKFTRSWDQGSRAAE